MINVNHQTVGGLVTEILFGREPMPWMCITVKTEAHVWDRTGRRAKVWCKEAVILQGSENVAATKALVRKGSYVFATGQRVPAYSVANEARLRGAVLLASTFQLQGDV